MATQVKAVGSCMQLNVKIAVSSSMDDRLLYFLDEPNNASLARDIDVEESR